MEPKIVQCLIKNNNNKAAKDENIAEGTEQREVVKMHGTNREKGEDHVKKTIAGHEEERMK